PDDFDLGVWSGSKFRPIVGVFGAFGGTGSRRGYLATLGVRSHHRRPGVSGGPAIDCRLAWAAGDTDMAVARNVWHHPPGSTIGAEGAQVISLVGRQGEPPRALPIAGGRCAAGAGFGTAEREANLAVIRRLRFPA